MHSTHSHRALCCPVQAHDIVLHQQRQLITLPVDSYHAAHPFVPLHSYHSIVNALTLLHHTALTAATPLAATLQTETPLQPAAIATLTAAFTAPSTAPQPTHTSFAYLDLQWKVGVTLADSASGGGDTVGGGGGVFVVLRVSVVDESGAGVREQCVELSVKEFRAFHRRIGEIATQMDNM